MYLLIIKIKVIPLNVNFTHNLVLVAPSINILQKEYTDLKATIGLIFV